jgi:hypothetical protein
VSPVPAFFVGLAVLLSFTILALVCVQRPLNAILLELCGKDHRARFWTRLYDVSLFALVAFFALWSPPNPDVESVRFHDYLGMLRFGLFALLAGLALLALVMMVSVGNHDREERASRRASLSSDRAPSPS